MLANMLSVKKNPVGGFAVCFLRIAILIWSKKKNVYIVLAFQLAFFINT